MAPALYEGVTVLFLAQLAVRGPQHRPADRGRLHGDPGGIGTAGVPSGSIPFIVVVLATVGVNPALIATSSWASTASSICAARPEMSWAT